MNIYSPSPFQRWSLYRNSFGWLIYGLSHIETVPRCESERLERSFCWKNFQVFVLSPHISHPSLSKPYCSDTHTPSPIVMYTCNWSGGGPRCTGVWQIWTHKQFRGALLNWFHSLADSGEVIPHRKRVGAGDSDSAQISYFPCCCHYRPSYEMSSLYRKIVWTCSGR